MQSLLEYEGIITGLIHETHLNEGCYGILHTHLKCNLVNLEIDPKWISIVQKSIRLMGSQK